MHGSSAQEEGLEPRQGAPVMVPLLLLTMAILFSPLLYDLLREAHRLIWGQ